MTPQERAARAYLGGATTQELAVDLGVHPSTVWRWLVAQGLPLRQRTPHRTDVPDAAVRRARRARKTWAAVAAETGLSPSGARRRYRAAYGDIGRLDLHTHLTAAQRRELAGVYRHLSELPGPRGEVIRSSLGAQGVVLRELLRTHHEAGVTWRELGEALGVTATRAGQIGRG